MPPTFVYLMAFTVWVGVAAATWLVAGVLAVFPSKRQTGLRLACAMAFTFPGIIIYQVLAAPAVAALLGTMMLLWKTLEPGPATTTSNPAVIAASIITVVLAFSVVLATSLAGVWEGWRLGWAFAAGESFKSTVRSGILFRIAHRVRSGVRASDAR